VVAALAGISSWASWASAQPALFPPAGPAEDLADLPNPVTPADNLNLPAAVLIPAVSQPLTLGFTDASTEPSRPTAIPLPSAGVTGLVLLSAMGSYRVIRRKPWA
jgi:hypothetical protein